MSGAATRIGRNRSKTWSSFGNLGRKPSEYEIVTHNMNHTWRQDGGQPLEMGANVHGNMWLTEHRDSKLFGVVNWNDFRDPDELTYRKYCQVQDEQETYVDELLKNFTAVKRADATLNDNALTFLQLTMTPCRYLGHAQQMIAAYLQQVSPSTYVANCATFETADMLRRVQRIAYRTKQLDNAHPVRGFGSGERAIWENDEGWQPIRRVVEEMLTEFDFDRVFVGYQLVLKPVLDNLLLQQFATIARSLGAEIDALIAENLFTDAQRSQRWTTALTKFIAAQGEGGSDRLRTLLADLRPQADAVIAAGARLLARHGNSTTAETYSLREERSLFGKGKPATAGIADAVEARVRSDWTAFITEAGLGSDA